MTKYVAVPHVALSSQVDGEWVNVGTVAHLGYPQPWPSAGAVVLYEEYAEIHDRVFEAVKPGALTKLIAGQKKPPQERQPTKSHPLVDRWGRLK